MSIIGRIGILIAAIGLIVSVMTPLSIVFSGQLNIVLLIAGLVPLAIGVALLVVDPGKVGLGWRAITKQVARTRTRAGLNLTSVGTVIAGVMEPLGVHPPGLNVEQSASYRVIGAIVLLVGAVLIISDQPRV